MTYQEFWRRLVPVCGEGEAKAVAQTVFELRYGLTLSDLFLGRADKLPADELEQLLQQLERQEPVQYVLGLAPFCGRTFAVDRRVLIPRPETEELCRWIMADAPATEATRQQDGQGGALRVLDVGTGSGCIAVTLAAGLPQARVTAWDISADALDVARQNAQRHGQHVTFRRQDALQAASRTADGESAAEEWDVIVSNPPYVCDSERSGMEPNVLDYEPHTALFVPDNDPLRFYRCIGRYALTTLTGGGRLYFEGNPRYAAQLVQLLTDEGFHDVRLLTDGYGKQRFVRATAPPKTTLKD